VKNNFAKSVIGSVVLAALMAGCSSETPEKLVGSAKSYLEKNDRKAALIQLKTAIQKNGNLSEARFLLAKTLSEMGDQDGALIELSKAGQLGYPDEEVQPLEARVLILQGDMERVLSRFAAVTLKPPVAQADLQTSLAVAYSAQGRLPEARKAVDQALVAVPKYVRARLVESRLKAAEGHFDTAFSQVEALAKEEPQRSDVSLLLGEFLEFKGEAAAAVSAYRKAVDLDAMNYVAKSRAIAALIQQQDYKSAQTVWDSMQSKIPNNLNTAYFGVLLAFERGDMKLAEDRLQPLLKRAADSGKVLYLAGAISFQKGAMTQAETYLGKAMSTDLGESSPGVRALLARVLIRIGNPTKAWTLVKPFLERPPLDPEIVAVGAEASLKLGEFARAESLFKQVMQLNPKDARARTYLAVDKLKKGEVELGIQELRAISEKEKAVTADLALISSLMGKKDYARALEAVAVLEKKEPQRPDAANLRGQIEVQKGSADKARVAFEAALKIDSQSFPAARGLADLDLKERKIEAAIARFDRMATENPKNLQARMAAIGLRAQRGAAPAELAGLLEETVKALPREISPREHLSGIYLEQNNVKKALTLAQDTATQFPGRPEALRILGTVQMAGRDFNQAEASYGKWAALQPNSVAPLMALGRLYVGKGEPAQALAVLKKALQIQPQFQEAQAAMASVLVGSGRGDEAEKLCLQIQREQPKNYFGYALAGDVAAFQKSWPAAVRWYKQDLNVDFRRSEVAMKLHKALLSGKELDAADKFAQERSKAYGTDALFLFYLGGVELARSRPEQAERWYAQVLTLQPENVAALNNLATLALKRKDGKAREYADKALALQPNSPGVMDTVADVYAAAGEYSKAVELQQKVVALMPGSSEFRLNLARHLLAAGQKDQAQTQLKKLVADDPAFASRAEFKAVQSKL